MPCDIAVVGCVQRRGWGEREGELTGSPVVALVTVAALPFLSSGELERRGAERGLPLQLLRCCVPGPLALSLSTAPNTFLLPCLSYML